MVSKFYERLGKQRIWLTAEEVNWPWSVKQHTVFLSYLGRCWEQRCSRGCPGTGKIIEHIPPWERVWPHASKIWKHELARRSVGVWNSDKEMAKAYSWCHSMFNDRFIMWLSAFFPLPFPEALSPDNLNLSLFSLCFLLPGKGQPAQVLALHLTPFQQTVAKPDSAVTHPKSVSSMHDQIPPPHYTPRTEQLNLAQPRPRVWGISQTAGRRVRVMRGKGGHD